MHEDPRPLLYLPFSQRPSGEFTLLLETHGDPGAMTALLKSELRHVEPGLVFLQVTTLGELMSLALWMDRAMAGLAASVARSACPFCCGAL